ncbi:MAG: ribosomal protein S18-alanine N-acetyltransferase [Armatimonadota bacterium]
MPKIAYIRNMTREDIPRVMEIERQCFTAPWNESAYITELTNRSAYYIVAEIDNIIVGFAGMWHLIDEGHITTIGVAKDYQGNKIGEQLLIRLLDETLKRRGHRATLEVRQSNLVAQNLYKKYGFKPVAVRRGYYTDNNENAIVMWVDNMTSSEYQKKFSEMKSAIFNGVGSDLGEIGS